MREPHLVSTEGLSMLGAKAVGCPWLAWLLVIFDKMIDLNFSKSLTCSRAGDFTNRYLSHRLKSSSPIESTHGPMLSRIVPDRPFLVRGCLFSHAQQVMLTRMLDLSAKLLCLPFDIAHSRVYLRLSLRLLFRRMPTDRSSAT